MSSSHMTSLAALLSTLAISGCTSVDAWLSGADVGAVNRGRVVAKTRCADCHVLRSARPARRGEAPAMSFIASRYSDRSLERELEMITDFGHYAMPPIRLDIDDQSDLAAYIATLR